ncbi:MAG: hypothetical protein U0I22_05855 [Treponema sp.]|nr:hypothetical protein [Treponema sp.]
MEGHRDPFDRMLIHRAIRNNMTMLSCDNWFKEYQNHGLHLLWQIPPLLQIFKKICILREATTIL